MKTHHLLSKLTIIAIATFALASCKKENDDLNNLRGFRKELGEAETLNLSTISTDLLLKDRTNGVDYMVTNTLDVRANLTIEPGVTIMFEKGTGILVRRDGSLTAIGQASNEIMFTSKDGKRGSWTGITILSVNPKNILEHVIVEQAGGDNPYGTANIIVGNGDDNGSVSIINSEITASQTSGIRMSMGSILREFRDNKIYTNTDFGLSMYIADAAFLSNTNTFDNNGKEFVQLTAFGGPVARPIELKKIDVPYLISEKVNVRNSFSIEPGTRLTMDVASALMFEGNNATFHAVGTEQSPISISAIYNSNEPGVWHYIQFNASNSDENRIEHCMINAGGKPFTTDDGMISVDNKGIGGSKVVFRNNTISNSAGYGIYIHQSNSQYNTDILSANSFTGNMRGNVRFSD